MKGLLVTVIDVLGIFVPGVLLLTGILLCPPITYEILRHPFNWNALNGFVQSNTFVFAILVSIVSYVLGFILRLISVWLLQFFTMRLWSKKLKARAEPLERILKSALNDEALCESLEAESKLYHSKYEVAPYTYYFPFAKRLIRIGSPGLQAETERLEAEIRFAAGIFLPLLLLVIDGLWLASFSGLILALVCGLGAVIILITFPARRIREVIYNYYLAIIVLRFATSSNTSGSDERAD